MRYVVLGASGYLGRHIVRQLVSDFGTEEVLGIGGTTASMPGTWYLNAQDGLKYISSLKQSELRIINCANSYQAHLVNKLTQVEVNYLWPLRLLGCINENACVRWLEVSSRWAIENSFGSRMTWYGTSKCAALTGLRRRVYDRQGSFQVAFVGDICGPDDPRGKVPSLSLALGQSNEQLFLTGGHQVIRPTDVWEAANSIAQLSCKTSNLRTQISGPPIQLNRFVELVNAHYDRKALVLREGPVAHWLYPHQSPIAHLRIIETSRYELLLERSNSART